MISDKLNDLNAARDQVEIHYARRKRAVVEAAAVTEAVLTLRLQRDRLGKRFSVTELHEKGETACCVRVNYRKAKFFSSDEINVVFLMFDCNEHEAVSISDSRQHVYEDRSVGSWPVDKPFDEEFKALIWNYVESRVALFLHERMSN